MMNQYAKLIGAGTLAMAMNAQAEVSLPKVISSHMVLQRDAKVPIWGWADQGEKVTVEFAGQRKSTLPDASGKWMIELSPMAASSEGQKMLIHGSNAIELDDVLVGEVWLASGQSNMEWSFNGIEASQRELALKELGNTQIRFFHVEHHLQAGFPLDDTLGRWKLSEDFLKNEQTVSALAFFFARKLQDELQVPIAILDANWGGMKVDHFISEDGYKSQDLPLRKHHHIEDSKKRLERLKQLRDSLNHSIAQEEKGITTPYIEDRVYSWADNIIYNAMIAPLTPYAIKGSIWYQGESNRGDTQYFKKLQALSYGWSKAFRVPNIPLYQVQIAPYDYSNGQQPKNSTLSDTIWAAQYKAAEEIEGVELVAIHDTDIHIKDIHPKSKQPVGERLASMALAKSYAKDVVCAGPSFAYARLVGDKVQVEFSQVDRGLQTKDGKEPSFFEVSADGTDFVPASAILQGNTVLLSAEACPKPRFVRMGWSDIAIPNLQDKNSWPVFSFPAQAIQH